MRTAILASLLSLVLAAPALALGPDPVHPERTVERASQHGPQSRTERWRGAPHVRAERDLARREALDRRLTRASDLTQIPSFREEEDQVRREALDKFLPIDLPTASMNPFPSF